MSNENQNDSILFFLYKHAISKIEYYKGLAWKFNIIYVAVTAFLVQSLLTGKTTMVSEFLYLIFLTYLGFGIGIIGIARQSARKIGETRKLLTRIENELGSRFSSLVDGFDLVVFDNTDKVVSCLSILVPITSVIVYSVVYLKFILA